MSTSRTLSIPWEFNADEGYVQYRWTNARKGDHGHFVASLSRDGSDPWSWSVRRDVNDVPLGLGEAGSRRDAESRILETLGKAFARTDMPLPSLGNDPTVVSSVRYEIRRNRCFYTLASGERVNLERFHGRPSFVRLIDGTVLRGALTIGEWMLVVNTASDEQLVHPAQVTAVELVP